MNGHTPTIPNPIHAMQHATRTLLASARAATRASVRCISSCAASRAYSTLPVAVASVASRSSLLRTAVGGSASATLSRTLRRTLFIQTQSTPNANSLKFLPGRDVSPEQSVDFSNYRDAARSSPLAAVLFRIDGVRSVYLASDFLSINIDDGRDWSLIKPEVYAVLMDFFASGQPVLLDNVDGQPTGVSSTTILPDDSEVVAMIKELIETRIRPAVQEDGGDIDYRSFDEETGKVLVQMQGSCKGCSSSSITLKNGIENMLMHYVPEVKCVEEYIDEEVEAVSADALKKLEEKLESARRAEQPQPIPTASPI